VNIADLCAVSLYVPHTAVVTDSLTSTGTKSQARLLVVDTQILAPFKLDFHLAKKVKP
jgi:hypothetical protein